MLYHSVSSSFLFVFVKRYFDPHGSKYLIPPPSPIRQLYKLGICLTCFSLTFLPLCPFAKSICLEKAFRNFNYGNNSSLAFTQVYSIVLKCKVRESVQNVKTWKRGKLRKISKIRMLNIKRL